MAALSLQGAAYDEGVEPHPPITFPAKFKDYQILPETLSPDRKYALIYPRRDVLYSLKDSALYLVALSPFQVLTTIPQQSSNFARNAHGSYQAMWQRDSTAVLVIEGIKWGPDKVFLATIRDESVDSVNDLTQQVVDAVIQDFRKSGAEPYNEFSNFIFYSTGNDSSDWRFLNSQQIAINCVLTTDPKDIVEHRWTIRFQAVLGISNNKLSNIKITRLSKAP